MSRFGFFCVCFAAAACLAAVEPDPVPADFSQRPVSAVQVEGSDQRLAEASVGLPRQKERSSVEYPVVAEVASAMDAFDPAACSSEAVAAVPAVAAGKARPVA